MTWCGDSFRRRKTRHDIGSSSHRVIGSFGGGAQKIKSTQAVREDTLYLRRRCNRCIGPYKATPGAAVRVCACVSATPADTRLQATAVQSGATLFREAKGAHTQWVHATLADSGA